MKAKFPKEFERMKSDLFASSRRGEGGTEGIGPGWCLGSFARDQPEGGFLFSIPFCDVHALPLRQCPGERHIGPCGLAQHDFYQVLKKAINVSQ